MGYRYDVTPLAVERIIEFYAHVKLKYQHTYCYDDMERDVRRAIFNSGKIEKTLLRRRPTLDRWQGYHMAHAGQWYYAYTINGDTITIEDACHAQNMHEEASNQ